MNISKTHTVAIFHYHFIKNDDFYLIQVSLACMIQCRMFNFSICICCSVLTVEPLTFFGGGVGVGGPSGSAKASDVKFAIGCKFVTFRFLSNMENMS